MVFCNAVVIGAGIFQFTQVHVSVFDLTAFVYIYLAFTCSVTVVELFTLLRYEVIALNFNLNFARHFVYPSSK